jgi:PAS domain S-box-containing protein
MPTNPKPSADAAEWRRRAEAQLKRQPARVEPGESDAARHRIDPDTKRLLHELQVHQLELELQNEELQSAWDKEQVLLAKYTDLYDFAPVGYLSLDREGTICEVNLTCASLLGIERSRLVQRRFGQFVSEADRSTFQAFLKKVFATKAREACEVSLLKEGKSPVEVRIEAVVAASGQELRATVSDITERKRAEVDRLILSKLESTGILAAGLAHDFNNLLTVITMNLGLAQSLSPAGGEVAACLKEAERGAFLASGLTRQLITFAKGGTPIRKLVPLFGAIQESVRLALSGASVRGEVSLADDLWLAEVDEGQIGQVIRNVVQNAREAMPAGGVVSVHAENLVLDSHEEPALPPGDYVRISITDRGGGIPAEVLPKIFDPYFSTKQRGEQKGMGLGLTVCHSIIQKHGGAIAVESKVGAGTTVRFCLPALRKRGPEVQAPSSKILPKRIRLLVMQDEESLRTILGATLRRLGYEAELVEDGQRAVEAYYREKGLGGTFDVVILDLTIRGGMGGQETILALRRIDPAVKAIVTSGYANDPVILDHERHGFKGALVKPFDLGQLQEVLARVGGN